jgi:hypothetical protein
MSRVREERDFPLRPRGREREERAGGQRARAREVRVRPPLQTLATVPDEWLTRGRGVAPREAYTCRDARRARHARLHAARQALAVRAVWELCAAACGQTDCLLPITERAPPIGQCVLCRACAWKVFMGARGNAQRGGARPLAARGSFARPSARVTPRE